MQLVQTTFRRFIKTSQSVPIVADISWIAEGLKVGGGAVLGWLGSIWRGQSKKRQMRRHLYKEIAENFVRVWFAISDTSGSGTINKLSSNMNFSYFDHAEKDMDTFHALDDYAMILSLYKGYREVAEAKEYRDMVQAAVKANEMVSTFVAFENDTCKALMTSAPDYARKPLLDGALARTHPSGMAMLLQNKHLRRYAPLMKATS
jgi:hypothetical protein